jgi:uncharacterized LabA/DUF88 family protein
VTTQNTQHEHRDVDAMVVEHPSAPEASVDSIASDNTTPAEAEVQVSTSSSETAEPADSVDTTAPAEEPVEAPSETSASSSVEPLAVPGATDASPDSAPLAANSAPEEASTPEAPVAGSETGHIEFPYRDVLSFAKESAKEVRPFTAFIEEFRLAEEQARRQVSLPETPAENLHLLSPAADDLSAPVLDDVPVEETTASAEEVTAPVEETVAVTGQEQPADDASEAIATAVVEDEASAELAAPSLETPSEQSAETEQIPAPAVKTTHESQPAASSLEKAKLEAGNSEAPTAEKSIPTPLPPERAVSPLLRPASRVRTPRHARHVREEAAAVEAPAELTLAPETARQASATPPVQSEQQVVAEPINQAPAVEQPVPPRPARRYRFDRPATSNGVTTTSSGRAEENKEPKSRVSSAGSLARAETATSASEQLAEPATKTTGAALQATELPVNKQQVQEPPVPETPSVSTPSSLDTGRRRGHDRQKETPVSSTATPSTPIVEPVTPAVEPATMQLEEIAPEDLPPLEYAELQKTTTTRRRRRHRSSSSNGSTPSAAETPVAPVAPSAPATPPAAQVTPPPAPSAPSRPTPANVPNGSGYSIVSGYTVSQMNQGNDTSGPFMGPDPSPARGSVMSRDGRTINRAETQRTPTPLYPGRTHSQDGGLTVAALNQLTSTFMQAMQNQTDRMVAEMRRSNSAPTSVSVTLPPFPSTERVGVFVDVANLLYSARTLRISVDFGKLLDFLRGNRRLVRAHAYCPTSPQAGDEQMFLQAVKGLGYRITTKNYKTFSSGAKKADLDLDLCMDVVRLVDGRAVDCIVLVSGDSDFMPMLDYCSDHGVRVEVAAFDEAMSATLRQSCDLFVNLSMLEEIRS